MASSKDTAPDTTPQGETPSVVWDDSKMKSSYANVCNVSSTREEVTLLFGTNQSRNAEEVRVALSDRIILNPFAAKRLSLLLAGVLKEYESLFGEIQVTPPAANKK